MHPHNVLHILVNKQLSRPGGSQFEVVRPRAGLYMEFFSAGERMD